jgi:hypothetical protein
METLKDILVNLFSDALWALGAFAFAYFRSKKNQLIVP